MSWKRPHIGSAVLVGTNVPNALEAGQEPTALLSQQHLETQQLLLTPVHIDTHTAKQGLSPPDADGSPAHIEENNAHMTTDKTKCSFCPQFYYSLELMVLAVWQE